MDKAVTRSVAEVIRAAQYLEKESSVSFIANVSQLLVSCFRSSCKVLIAGNGGSLCDAMHFAEELTGQFRSYRKALPAIALADPSHMSCVANDMGFDSVFSRGVEALGSQGDVLILLTTSGNSANITKACEVAKSKRMYTVAFLGKTGGQLLGKCDLEWVVSGFPFSDRIQEAHMAALHIIVEMVEKELFTDLEKEISLAGTPNQLAVK